MYFKKFDNFHLIHLIAVKLDVFNFHPVFFYITNYTFMCKIWTRFFKNIHQKWKYYREENWIKLNSVRSLWLMVLWREEQTLWDVMLPSYWDKNEKDESFRSSYWRCSLKKVLLEILQIRRKTPVPESLF